MKFLAILSDSLRESIDAKVFYVMLGLSGLLILLALSCQFVPLPAGAQVMEQAILPLNGVRMLQLGPNAELQAILGNMMGRFKTDVWSVNEVATVEKKPDSPDSTFKMKLTAKFNRLLSKIPANPEAYIRENFGQFDDWRMAEVVRVEPLSDTKAGGLRNLLEPTSTYEVEAQLTAAGRRLWPNKMSLLWGLLPLYQNQPVGHIVFDLESGVLNELGAWIAIIVSVVITAFFVPNMLRKGTIDLLIAKPISRVTLLIYKYVGGLLFILINTAVAVGGVWLAFGIRSGVWSPMVLVSILTITFYFAILYSVSVMFGVLTRSTVATILLTCVVWVGLFAINTTQSFIQLFSRIESIQRTFQCTPLLVSLVGAGGSPESDGSLRVAALLAVPPSPPIMGGPMGPRPPRRWDVNEESPAMYTEETHPLTRPLALQNWFTTTVNWLQYLLPRTSDLSNLTTLLLARDLKPDTSLSLLQLKPITWTESLTVSGLFIALMLGLACWRFVSRDY